MTKNNPRSERTGPLSHLKVLDMSRVLAGPWCGQLLADFGADVIKVERTGAGDDTRGWGPPFLKDEDGNETAEAAYYLAANRAKRSLTLDLSDPQDQALATKLASEADILLENYKVGGLKKFGLDYASLSALNPKLIYCSITGFGQTGPYAERAGYDLMIQGAGGLMSLTGVPDGEPGGGPQKAGVAAADLMTGMYATVAVLAALGWRDKTGEGQYIDLALLDTQAAMLANHAMNYLISGTPPGRVGNDHVNIVPYGVFPTSDGHIILCIGNNGQFEKFLAIAGQPELLDDARFADNKARVANRNLVNKTLHMMTVTRTMDEWLEDLEPAGVPAGPINTLDRVYSHPQILARGMRVPIPHSLGGTVDYPGNPIKFSKTPVDYPAAAPLLGEHSAEVLQDWLGLDDDELAALGRGGEK